MAYNTAHAALPRDPGQARGRAAILAGRSAV